MPFDSFMTSALTWELSQKLTGLKVDRICQPERDEIDLLFHVSNRNRLVINCTASTPFMALSDQTRENPAVPPMMCMLLRKHLSRAKITEIHQHGFDRIIRIAFDSGDEMGFRKTKYLYCEMMGRGSNLIFADDNGTILAAFRQNDITTKFDRIVMVGVPYVPMPPQDKLDPTRCSKEEFLSCFDSMPRETRCDLFLQKQLSGFGKLTAREIAYLAAEDPEASLSEVCPQRLWESLIQVVDRIRNNDYKPCLIYESRSDYEMGKSPLDFSFMPITHLHEPFYIHFCESVSESIERYYLLRNQTERQKQHYNDIAQILKNCKSRLEKKISAQMFQLEEANNAEVDKRMGDLIMQEMYRVRRGDTEVIATDYNGEVPVEVTIPLEQTLTPSQNAQRYYREYQKKKTAQVMIREQLKIAREELEYANSVMASLQTATTSLDLQEIREELSHWNYGRRLTASLKKPQAKKAKAKPRETKTQNGFTILIGMNNLQNDTVSTSLAEKQDLWFHVKNYHGSHVLLKAQHGKDFNHEDIELAASYAAFYSELNGSDRVEVDYTLARFIKKPNGSKPGFITYKNHKTAFVVPKELK